MATQSVTATARSFDAANSESLTIADNASLSFADEAFTATLWVKTDVNGDDWIFGKWGNNDSPQSKEYALYIKSDNTFNLQISGNGSTQTTVAHATTVSTGTWYFVAVNHDPTANTIGISVNGSAYTTAAHTTGIYASGTETFAIGNRDNDTSPDAYFDGQVASLNIWREVLDSDDIAALYNSGNGVLYHDNTVDTTNLEAWWNLAETSGVAWDAHGSNHLTDNNTVTFAAGKVAYTANDSRDFDRGTAEHFLITDAAQTGLDIGGNDNLYFCAWIHPDTLASFQGYTIASKWNWSDSKREWGMGIGGSDDKPYMQVSYDGAAVATALWGSAVNTGAWYFVEGYHDGTADVIGVSVNRGTDVTTAHSTGIYQNDAGFSIGAFDDTTSKNVWDGRIQNAVYISGIPTAAERDSLYNGGLGVDYADKPALSSATYVSWWELDEASGNAIDAHASNDLTDKNTVGTASGVVLEAQGGGGGGGGTETPGSFMMMGIGT